MQALVDLIVRNLMALWPIAKVLEWETAILVRCGRIVRVLGHGLHWRWPFFDEVKTWPGNEVCIDLASGAITTSDGRCVTVSANCRYRLFNAALGWKMVWSFETSIKQSVLGILCTGCASRTWDELTKDRRALEAALVQEVNDVTSAWGIRVTAMNLTDLVLSDARHHYSDGSLAR